MRMTDLTNEELEGLVELVQAHQKCAISTEFLNRYVNLLEFAVAYRKVIPRDD